MCFKTKGLWLQKSGRVLHANGHTSLMPYKEMVQAWLEATEEDLLGVVTVPQQASVNQICSGEHESPSIEKFMQRMKEKYGAIMVDELPPQHEREAEHEVVHHIQLVPGAEPIAEPLRRMSPKLLEELKTQLDEYLERNLMTISVSCWMMNHTKPNSNYEDK